jgi:LmbE family N-acetylglucosaminyl deacetylase
VAERMNEARASASAIDGASDSGSPRDDRVIFLQRVDGALENGIIERRDVARIIRTIRPATLLGHDPWRRYRLHPDHRAAGFLTLDALVAARDPHFFAELELPPHRPDALLLFEADQPNHLEDATGFESAKVEALLCHTSQWESTMGIDGTARTQTAEPSDSDRARFASKVHRQLADHGSLAGHQLGEAFHLMTDL